MPSSCATAELICEMPLSCSRAPPLIWVTRLVTMEEMQRVADRLARDAELFGELVLPDAMPRRQAEIDDALHKPLINLIDQVRTGVERDHDASNSEFGIPKWRIDQSAGESRMLRLSMTIRASRHPQVVITGLDPVIHLSERFIAMKNGLPGQARQ